MPGTYDPINIGGTGSGIPIDGGEFGEFEFGFDEFGGGTLFPTGATFSPVDASSHVNAASNNSSQVYSIINVSGG